MTVVRATCPDCGDVKTTVENVTLRFKAETKFEGAQYRFICPQCNKIVLKDAGHEVAVLLYSSGVAVERWEPSIEIMQRPREDLAKPIDLDDIIELGLLLENDEAFMREFGWREES